MNHFLVSTETLLFVNIFFILLNAHLALFILFLISSSHLPSSFIKVPRKLNLPTCLTKLSSILILTLGFITALDITITSVFDLFIFKPFLSLTSFSTINKPWSFPSESATSTISSAYFISLILYPFNFIPSNSLISLIIISLYRLNKSVDITQPCRTPLSIHGHFYSSSSTFTSSFWLQKRFLIIFKSLPFISSLSNIFIKSSPFTLSKDFL